MLWILLSLLAGENLAFGKTYPWSLLPGSLGRVLWLALTGLFVIGLLGEILPGFGGVRRWTQGGLNPLRRSFQSRAILIVLVCMSGAFALWNYFKFRPMGYTFPVGSLVLCLAFLPWVKRERTGWLVVFNLGMLACSIVQFPLNLFRSDMVLVIKNALDAWWIQKDPYLPQVLECGATGMPYFPGILFSHFPAWFLGLDLRWNQFVYRAVYMGILWRLSKKLAPQSLVRDGINFYLANPYLMFRHDLYFEIYPFLIALYFMVPRLRSLWIPVLAITSQWCCVLVPFLWLREVYESSQQTRVSRIIQLVLMALIVFALVFWLLASSTTVSSFLASAFFVVRGESAFYSGDYGISLGYLGELVNGKRLFLLLQVGAFFLFLLKDFLEQRQGIKKTGLNSSLALVFFTLFAMHFWIYFWLFSMIWILFVVIEEERSQEPHISPR